MLHVPCKSNALAMTDVMSGQVDIMITDIGLAHPPIKASKVIALAVTGPDRAGSLPELPTMAVHSQKSVPSSHTKLTLREQRIELCREG